MNVPSPSLNSAKGVLVMILGVALALAVLTQTRIGGQLMTAINGVVSKAPV